MKTKYIVNKISYNGAQLRSNFAFTEFDIIGDSIVAFCGPCDIPVEKMVDIEDAKNSKRIYSESMIHFIVEHHESDLEKAVLRQLLLATIVGEVLDEMRGTAFTMRIGSDIYDEDAKISVSIATITPLSSLIHFGVNILSDNTPVKTKGLKDYGIEPCEFAKLVMARYKNMQEDIHHARCKVRWRE